ncbi:Fic/DOC family protein [Nocardioides alkalitolerans]|uniref:Fic/DOC family protein n=1 Tax=Nocardioides alkalitolerans TaxID=281714 RepID=UPI0004913F2A|nr:Fic family protein [Nocardioides alkalitolerans]
MASTEPDGLFVDPYLDPDTVLLRNKVGARTKVALEEIEGDLAFVRLVQLTDRPAAWGVKATGDLDELRAIHRHLFGDVYDWAGELRTVDVRKNVEGAGYFLPVSMIERASVYAAEELRADDHLRGMERGRFIKRLAHHYDQFNYIHPFREGNGRTQRVLWNRVARDAGWQLDWRLVHGSTNDAACRAASDQHDLALLRAMFDRIVTEAAPVAGRDPAWQAAELARLSFPSSTHAGGRADRDREADHGRTVDEAGDRSRSQLGRPASAAGPVEGPGEEMER